jgi:hypothetical protein
LPEKTDEEKAARAAIDVFKAGGFGYFLEQATRPQTIGYALLDSPIALAAWLADHDTDAYYKIASAFVDDKPSGNLTRDHILDNITLYWLTGTGESAARSYWEAAQLPHDAAAPAPISPVSLRSDSPRSRARSGGPRAAGSRRRIPVVYFNEVDKGGHFAAWEAGPFSKNRAASGRCARESS